MEKGKPSFSLDAFKRVAGNRQTLDMTESAADSAEGLGFEPAEVTACVRSMTRQMFYKSMTSYRDHKKWQDVYHVPVSGGPTIYLKFTDNVITEFTVLSFKELGRD